MKTIIFNSTKGGTGKSTLSIITLNALAGAGYKCLAIDTDMINHSLSFYFNRGISFESIYEKNIFHVFTGSSIKENTLPVTDHNGQNYRLNARVETKKQYEELKSLKEQGLSLKQIADVLGKTEQSIKHIFTGINEIKREPELKNYIGAAGGTIPPAPPQEPKKSYPVRLMAHKERRQMVLSFDDDEPYTLIYTNLKNVFDTHHLVCIEQEADSV